MRQIAVWSNGCEAQITVQIGDAEVTFYDTQYLINHVWYQAGDVYDFILTGIANQAQPTRYGLLTAQQDPEVAA
jgi:hypothetical protein